MRLSYVWRVAWVIAWSSNLAPSLAAAQAEPAAAQGIRVAVLRATEGDASTLANDVDGALLRDLAAIAGIEHPTVSPIDYAEIQLTVGCSDEGRECLSSIAQLVQVDTVVVRQLAIKSDRVDLTVMYFDASTSSDPARVDQSFEGSDAGARAVSAVPALIRKLFGVPEPVVAASPEPTVAPPAPRAELAPVAITPQASGGATRVGALTWITLAAGAGVLAGGIVLGVTAQSSFDSYTQFEPRSTADVARANSQLDSAESKALAADVMTPVGGAVLALGGVLLALDLMRDDKTPSLALLPVRGGALLSMRAVAGGL